MQKEVQNENAKTQTTLTRSEYERSIAIIEYIKQFIGIISITSNWHVTLIKRTVGSEAPKNDAQIVRFSGRTTKGERIEFKLLAGAANHSLGEYFVE